VLLSLLLRSSFIVSKKVLVNPDPEGFRRYRLFSGLACGSSFEPLLSTLEGLKVFALGKGHCGVGSVGVFEYASGLRLVVGVFDSDRRLHLSLSPVGGLRQRCC